MVQEPIHVSNNLSWSFEIIYMATCIQQQVIKNKLLAS